MPARREHSIRSNLFSAVPLVSPGHGQETEGDAECGDEAFLVWFEDQDPLEPHKILSQDIENKRRSLAAYEVTERRSLDLIMLTAECTFY